MQKSVTFIAIIAVGLVVTGCNTVHGIGRDVKSAGGAVADAAKK
jgi:predicted small secreted protein